MIVWLAEQHIHFEGSWIVGVYSTKELAEAAIKADKLANPYGECWTVTEWLVDGDPLDVSRETSNHDG